jgi:hypothetical protein
MTDEESALGALKNAWAGALATAEPLRHALPALAQIAPGTPVEAFDLETYHRLALAHANAAQALRGLVEQLRRKVGPGDGESEGPGSGGGDGPTAPGP